MSLCIFAARIYDDQGRYQEGLRTLHRDGAKIAMMNYSGENGGLEWGGVGWGRRGPWEVTRKWGGLASLRERPWSAACRDDGCTLDPTLGSMGRERPGQEMWARGGQGGWLEVERMRTGLAQIPVGRKCLMKELSP